MRSWKKRSPAIHAISRWRNLPSQYENITRSITPSTANNVICAILYIMYNGWWKTPERQYTIWRYIYNKIYHKRDFPFYFIFSVVLLRRMYYRTLSLSPLSPHFLNIKHDVSSIQPIESSVGRFGSAHWTSRVTCVKQDPSLYRLYTFLIRYQL
jgi:hypothetical protein